MSDEITTRSLQDGDELHSLIMEMVNAMKQAVAPYIVAASDPRDGISAAMTAGSMFAGAQFGGLMVLGVVRQQDTRRAADVAGRSFREGIKVGARQAARVEAEQYGGRA